MIAAPLDLIEVTHPNFSKKYRIVSEANARWSGGNGEGIAVKISDEEQQAWFDYYPARITAPTARDDSDAIVKVELGDVGETIAQEMDNLAAANGFLTKPEMRYWLYQSDILSTPLVGPINLEISDIEFAKEGASFEATAKQLNTNGTGVRYVVSRFEMLRGFVN